MLCTASKVMEHFVFKHIASFLEDNNFFSEAQHGFRRGLSTATQLIHTSNDFCSTLDKMGQIDAIFLDFEKAFDRVLHSKLLLKLRNILQNQQILQWLDSYLSHRQQYVQISTSSSPIAPVFSGVPQGSVLGPLLFLIYLNDLKLDSPVRARFFADDCVVYHTILAEGDQTILNNYLCAVSNWCQNWTMSLNVTKCKQMTLTRKKVPLQYSYTINSASLEPVEQFKYLGVTFSANLSWSPHIKNMVSVASKRLWLIRHRLKHATTKTRLVTYTSLVRPLLEYADVV